MVYTILFSHSASLQLCIPFLFSWYPWGCLVSPRIVTRCCKAQAAVHVCKQWSHGWMGVLMPIKPEEVKSQKNNLTTCTPIVTVSHKSEYTPHISANHCWHQRLCVELFWGDSNFTLIQSVHWSLCMVSTCYFFSVVSGKDIMKYLQKCKGCTHLRYCVLVLLRIAFPNHKHPLSDHNLASLQTYYFFFPSRTNWINKLIFLGPSELPFNACN